MAQQGALTGHVRSGDHHDLLPVGVEAYIVGYVGIAGLQLLLDHGVPTGGDVEHVLFVHFRAAVVLFACHAGKTEQAIELSHYSGIVLDGTNVFVERGQ